MPKRNFTISAVIYSGQNYHSSSGWGKGIREASLYPAAQVPLVMEELKRDRSNKPACKYVVQNKNFDYFSGSDWVYTIQGAKLYATLLQAESKVKSLAKEAV